MRILGNLPSAALLPKVILEVSRLESTHLLFGRRRVKISSSPRGMNADIALAMMKRGPRDAMRVLNGK